MHHNSFLYVTGVIHVSPVAAQDAGSVRILLSTFLSTECNKLHGHQKLPHFCVLFQEEEKTKKERNPSTDCATVILAVKSPLPADDDGEQALSGPFDEGKDNSFIVGACRYGTC